MTILVNFVDMHTGEVFQRVAQEEGRVLAVDLPTRGLSVGSSSHAVGVGLSVHTMRNQPFANRLLDGRIAAGVVIPRAWDTSYMPGSRALWEILDEAVTHGRDNPTHGSDCVCMDNLVREVRRHMMRALPPDTAPHEFTMENESVRARRDARMRVSAIMHMASRTL